MSVRKRKWIGPSGETKLSWVVDFKDLAGKRRLRTFCRKKDADRFATKVRAELLDADLKLNDPAATAIAPGHGSIIPEKDMKMNEHSNTTAAAKVPVSIQLLRASDVLATAKDLNEAIHMACGYISVDPEKCAIQAVSDALGSKLSEALHMIEVAREELA
ncbi:hypothetical protein HGP14_30700 [Rhizobium sp. P32RR-XVIII]|uniref:hypothetical protein n=1 Tax=Rhizobium sp. P32RR-XVIII TaxID=2726738 RepID=UPI00145695C1|nr:hypothetical protein [Rhizobium sp. P32RR-XVIII]NLS07636.1 hypothetical protein [Rhizobium sp. P32RR-XVIII]